MRINYKADALIARCEKVKTRGDGRWVACCPAHADSTPSLAIRELDDGRVLVHCFAGCGVAEILAAVGLTFDALFPDKLIAGHVPGLRAPFPAADVMAALEFEIDVLAICAGDLSEGRALTDEAKERMRLARERFEDGRALALGKR